MRRALNPTNQPVVVQPIRSDADSVRALFSNYITYEQARAFRQLLTKRLGLIGLIVGVAWAVGIVPMVGLLVGMGLLVVTVGLAGRFERAARRNLDAVSRDASGTDAPNMPRKTFD